jgi:hypothetical protein
MNENEKAITKRIDPKTGKLIIEGYIHQELDFQTYHDRLTALEDELTHRAADISKKKTRLNELSHVKDSKRLKEIRELAAQMKELDEKLGIEKSLPELEKNFADLKKDFEEQKELDKEFMKLKK